MMKTSRTTSFDGWELRADVGELTKNGRKIRLQQHPLLVLDELLANPGELVTREQLIARLWPKGVVDFDTGINTAVRKLRVALDDVGEIPRYIETLPRKGYRFIGTIDAPPADVPPAAAPPAEAPPAPVIIVVPPSAPVPVEPAPEANFTPEAAPVPVPISPPAAPRHWLRYGLAAAVLLAVGVLVFFARRESPAAPSASPAAAQVSSERQLKIALLPLQAATATEPDDTLAKIVGDQLRNRLGKLDGSVVIDAASLSRQGMDEAALRHFGESVHARYFLDGRVARKQEQVHVNLELRDAITGEQVWKLEGERGSNDVAGLIEEAFRGVARSLRVGTGKIPESYVPAPINLDAYAIYLRARELMKTQRVADVQLALELFRRAAVLDAGFARAYVGVGQALIFLGSNSDKTDDELAVVERETSTALERALALDPGLGEVLIEQARVSPQSADAEKLYREGLRLAPNYGVGHMRYAEFLFDEYRRGEAIEEMDRARALDPLEPRLHLRQALFRLLTNSDIVAHDRLVGEALAINPRLVHGAMQLGIVRYIYAGDFAEAVRYFEEAIALDPQSDLLKFDAATIYLDLDDPDAALALLKQCAGSPRSLVELAQYRRDPRRAAQLARAVPAELWRTTWPVPEATALRDEAIATGNFAGALELMSSRFARTVPWGPVKTSGLRLQNRGLGLVYAHTLVAAGETQRGRNLALEILAQLDGESVGRPEYFLSRERAAASVILGDQERALVELKNSLSIGHYYFWWYLGDLDPLYAGLRADPRFQALVAQAKQHRVQQRALLDEMRRSGKVPKR